MQLLILLSLFSIVLSRPTFSTKPVDGVLNYAKGKLLKDNIVTLDDKETITMISCKPDSMNFTLTKKETKLKVGALVTGGPEWNCTKKEPFYRKIIKIANSTSNGIEVNTEDVPQKDFFRIAYGYEVCSKNMQNATSILKNITKLKKTVEDNLAKAEALTSEINKNGNQSVGKKILKDIKRTRAEMKKTFSEANQRVKAMEKISKEKKKVVLGTVKCDLGSLRKLLTKTQKHEKIASETLKKAQDAHKTVRSSYADVLTKVNSTLSAVFSFIDSANKNPSSLTPAQKTELSAIISKRDSILKNANAARTEKDSKKADAAIKEAKKLDSRANLLKVTLSKQISAHKKAVNTNTFNTNITGTGTTGASTVAKKATASSVAAKNTSAGSVAAVSVAASSVAASSVAAKNAAVSVSAKNASVSVSAKNASAKNASAGSTVAAKNVAGSAKNASAGSVATKMASSAAAKNATAGSVAAKNASASSVAKNVTDGSVAAKNAAVSVSAKNASAKNASAGSSVAAKNASAGSVAAKNASAGSVAAKNASAGSVAAKNAAVSVSAKNASAKNASASSVAKNVTDGSAATKMASSAAAKIVGTIVETGFNELKCNKNPTIERKSEAYMVSYYDKPVANMKNEILILDKVDEVAYVCCTNDEIELFFKPGKAILKRLDKVSYITGGKGWGCNNEIIQYQVSKHNGDQVSYSFHIKSKVDSSVFLRELTSPEICIDLLTKINAEQKTHDDLYKKADASFKEIKNSYNHMKSIGDDATKKDGQAKFEESEKAMNEVKKIHAYGFFDCINGPFPTEKILTSLKEKNTQLTTLLDQLKSYANTTAVMSTGIPITAANVAKLVTELAKTTDAFFADIKLIFDLNNLSDKNKKAFNDEKSRLKNKLDSLINEALSCKDDAEAKRIYSDVEKEVKAYKELIANINKDIGTTKEKREMKSSTGEIFDEIKGILSNAKKDSLCYGKDHKDPECVQLIGDMEKTHAEAKKKWDELKKFVDDTSETSKKKIEELDIDIAKLRDDMKGFNDSFDAVLKKYQDFRTERSAVEKIISDATKKKREIAAKDKELAAKLEPQIVEASKAVNRANKAFERRKLEEATKLLADAKTKAEAALNSAGSTTVSTANYSEADTSKDNVRQRVKLITDESNAIVKKVQVNIDLIKKYDEDVSKSLEKEFESLKNKIEYCNDDAKSWFKTEESSKKAFICSQEAQEAIKKFSLTVDEKLKTSTAKFSLPINGKVLSIPSNKVKKLTCKGTTVTIEFKEAVFVDPNFDQIAVDETIACVDENTNKRLAMKRKVTKVTENTEKKLIIETEFANSQSNEIVSEGASFSGIPVFSDSKVSAILNVTNAKYLSKKAVVELIASGSLLTSTPKKLSTTTSIALTIDKSITCNSAILSVSVDGVRIASSESFSINPTIAFLQPDVAGRKYYNEEKIEVKMKYDDSQSSKGVNTLKLVSAETKLAVYSKNLETGEKVDIVAVQKLPEEVKSGDYYFELTVNGVTVKSQTISIIRDQFANQQIVFSSPKTGESYDPGQTIPIRWEVKNPRKSGKLKLGLAVQNSFLSKILGTPYVGGNIPIEKGSHDFVVPEQILGDSRYYVYAEYDCSFIGFCAKDQSGLFAIKSKLCFNFTDIHVSSKAPGEYLIHVSVENTGNCQFTKDDKIEVKMVTADNLKDRQVGFVFSGDQKSVTEPLRLTKGEAASLRFMITHKHTENGEFSWDFSTPFESNFSFDFGKFKPDWSCEQCVSQKPWKISSEAERVAGKAIVEINEKYDFFCNTLCNTYKFKLDRFKKKATNDTENRIIAAVCNDTGSPEDIVDCTKSGKRIFKKIASFNPSFKIECRTCKIDGWVKVYDLDSRGPLIRAGTIELKINYHFEAVLTLGISKTVAEDSFMAGPGEEQRDKNGKLLFVGYNQNKLKEGSIASAIVGDLLDLEALDIPILGAKAGLGAVRVPDKPDTFNLTAALMFYVKIQVKLTGHVKALFTAKGEINYIGSLQSGKKMASNNKNNTPSPKLEFIELEVGLTLTLSIGGTANFAVGKIIGADLTLDFLRFVGEAKFRLPAWPALTSAEATKGLIDSNQICKKPHHLELSGDLYFISLKLSLTVLGNSQPFTIIEETHVQGFRFCLIPG